MGINLANLLKQTFEILFNESQRLIKYILSLKDLQNLPVITGPCKIGFIG